MPSPFRLQTDKGDNKPTGYYSSRQEKQIAKAVGGKTVKNSGATLFDKGDVTSDNWLFEAKTKVKESDSITVKKEWFDKNNEERIAMHKQYSAVVISFGDGKNYYCVDEKTFTLMQEALSELEE